MAMNPVLYNIANLQSGRGTGAFRGVRVAPELRNTEIPTFDSKRADELLTQLNTKRDAFKTSYDPLKATYDAIPDQIATADYYLNKLSVGSGTWWNWKTKRNILVDQASKLSPQLSSLSSQYQSSIAPLQTERTSMRDTYKNAASRVDHLAFAAPDSESAGASPTISEGASLAATDLYSDTLESEVIGRKQIAQTTSEPEDDLVSGAVESSIYSRGK